MSGLIPAFEKTEYHDGQFNVDWQQPLTIVSQVDGPVGATATQLADWLKQFCERSLFEKTEIRFQSTESSSALVQLTQSDAVPSEGYELSILPERITIAAKRDCISGWQYGLLALFQLLWDAKQNSKSHLRCQEISDCPAFPWRGLHLDVCRHFFDVSFIKRLLDLMVLHRLNRFHWHLTEDQGWRLEIPSRPGLAEISAWRDQDGKKYGGFFTADDVRQVVQYAADRGIEVVPEIELPGHSVAALAAYPELACQPRDFSVETNWGIFEDVYCAGNEQTFEFLQEVMDHVISLFPGEVIHIGGDECPKTRWKECPKCQSRIASEGLRDEEHLQSYFVQRMVNYLAQRGRRAIGWDEILEGGLADGAMVMSWRGHEGGITAAKMGHDVVMSPTSHCYFDYRQQDTPEEMGFHGVITLKDVFDFQPVPPELSEEEAKHVLGGQANIWTERQLFKEENVEYMVVPRICALAEVLWRNPGRKESDWADFRIRLESHFRLLTELGYQGRPFP